MLSPFLIRGSFHPFACALPCVSWFTLQYMAPEMLLQRGHGRVVDWWCLGLLMHEMLTGRHPFQGASHYDTLRAMVTAEPTIDPRVTSYYIRERK